MSLSGPGFRRDAAMGPAPGRRQLIERLRGRFLEAGGALYQRTSFVSANTAPDGVLIRCGCAHQVHLQRPLPCIRQLSRRDVSCRGSSVWCGPKLNSETDAGRKAGFG